MMNDNTKDELLPTSNNAETALDIAAFVGSAIPWIGGPVSNVLSGMSLGRKLRRVGEILEGVVSDLGTLESEVSEKYVKTEEFEDLLEQTLRRAGEERNEEKRATYRAFLTNAIRSPGDPYDDQMHILRTLEQIGADHVRVLNALLQVPEPNVGSIGSPSQTLARRIPELDRGRIKYIVEQLVDMRLVNIRSLEVTMTGPGAADLRHSITQDGHRLARYLMI